MKTFKQFYESLGKFGFSERIDHTLETLYEWDRDNDLGIGEWVKSNTPDFDVVEKLAVLMLKGQHKYAEDLAVAASNPEEAYRNAAFIAITSIGLDTTLPTDSREYKAKVFYAVRAFVSAHKFESLTDEQIRERLKLYDDIRNSQLYKTLWDVMPKWAWKDFDPAQNPLK